MVGVTLLHLVLLHLGIEDHYDFIPFYPYFLLKDIFGLLLFLFVFSYLVFFSPNLLGHPDNYIRANPIVTPPHIVPEWYFLPFYAILRAVPSKLGGVVAMGAAIGILFFLPTIDKGNYFLLYWSARAVNYLRTFSKRKTSRKLFKYLPKADSEWVNVYRGPTFRPVFKFLFIC
jgi:quinol-cytochrome oxidoreductase complex cytochrome b subunit